MTQPIETTTQVTLSTTAAEAVREILTKKNLPGYALRLYISGGGCSGYQYGLALDSNIRAEDRVIESGGIKLIVDEVSINYLQGATVDYVEDMTGSGFKINNPNAITTCNCGQSFNSTDGESSNSCSGCG